MVNKKKMIIMVSAIALVAATSAGIYSVTNNTKTVSNEIAYAQIDDEDVPLGIKNSFDDAIESYYKDGLSYDEMIAKIEADLKEYIDSTGNFTTEQSKQLNTVVKEYLNDSVVYPDTDKNDEAIKTITALINERYTQNYNYIAAVEKSIADLPKTDDDHYKELTDMDKRLKKWLDESAENQRKDLSEAQASMTRLVSDTEDSMIDYARRESDLAYNKSHTELTSTTEDLKTLIDDLAKTAKADNGSSYELVKAITGAKDFDSSKTYNKGDIVISNGSLFMAATDGVNDLSGFEATDLNTSMLTLNREFNSSIDEMKVYVDGLNATTNERIDALSTDINELEKSTTAYINKVSEVLNSTDSDIYLQINKVKSALSASKTDTEKYVADINSSLESLNTELEQKHREVYDTLRYNRNYIVDEVRRIDNNLSVMNGDIQSVRNIGDNLRQEMEDQKQEIMGDYSIGFAEVNDKVNNLDHDTFDRETELMQEINTLKQELAELKTDMEENYINKNDLTFSVNGDDLTITKNY